jgi:hypothetical protein
MYKNASTKSDEMKRKTEFKSETWQIYRLISSIGGHHIVPARRILELSPEGMRNSQDECVRGSGASAGITV